jgi:hypothetical protein
MEVYAVLGHMESATKAALNFPEYYLPRHAVVKESSSTMKVMVVFDGSAKTTTDISLNDILMVSPTVQQKLFSILI